MLEKYNGNFFETIETSLVVLSIESVKLCFTKLPLPKIYRVHPMSNINDCTKFEDNRPNQSELRAQ